MEENCGVVKMLLRDMRDERNKRRCFNMGHHVHGGESSVPLGVENAGEVVGRGIRNVESIRDVHRFHNR